MKKRHPLLSNGLATVVTHDKALQLFQEILNTGVPFAYQQANCHNVSHYICLFLASKGIIGSKIWAFTPGIYSGLTDKLITFVDRTRLSPNGKIDWGYHVAPVLHVQMGHKIEKMVIDPVLFPDGPVKYRIWLSKLKTKKLIYLLMDAEWYLFNSSLIPNSQFQYSEFTNPFKPNIILPDWFSDKLINDFFKYEEFSKDNHWLEKGLAINETAIQFYNQEIKPILNDFTKKELLKDYRDLVGNVFNFETVFRDNMWNYEMTEEFQHKHQVVIQKYRIIYHNEVLKWQQKMVF